jgi:hypothetical protein
MSRKRIGQEATTNDQVLVPTSIEAALPGEGQVEKELLDQAVHEINRMHAGKTLETARLVGEYVLATFFGGDPENFRNRGKKHVTFQELARREDMHPSYTFIWRAVSVVDQLRLLPENVVAALPYTHHAALLPVRDEGAKKRLAERAALNSWSKRKLLDEVSKVRSKEKSKTRVGRPPLPGFVKSVQGVRKALLKLEIGSVTDEAVARYSLDKTRELKGKIAEMLDQLRALEAQLDQACASAESKLQE